MTKVRREEAGTELRREEGGAAAVEFVMVITLLALLLFSMVELALIFQTRTMVVHAARDGARRAAIAGGDTVEVREFIEHQLELGRVNLEDVELEIRPRTVAYGSTVYVTIHYEQEPLTPLIRTLFGGPVPVTAEVLARAERLQ